MDIDRCARVILSGAGRETGHLVDDPVRMAAAIVGRDAVVPAAHALADDWVSSGGTIICADDPTWPEGLVSLGGAQPLLLWVRGSLPGARCEMVSVVGSRECTAYGRDVAAVLARQACASGLTVVSGGALGIDSHAHTGALEAGGKTVLVAAGGAGRVYPSPHEKLFREAAAAGAVIWEHPPGTRLTQRGFLHRNRLIAALSGVTVLVEAAERSGALNTGRTAADLGRLVLGVPGRIDSPASSGIHRAIADGWAAILLGANDLSQFLASAA